MVSAVWQVNELLSLVPEALELVRLLWDGNYNEAEHRAKALAQSITLKKTTREAAKVKP